MRDFVLLTGMVLKTSPVNDYDRRLVILTKERGKITVFARGARRQGSRYLAATNPFSFGQFKLFEGKDAYNLGECEISYYFDELRTDYEGMCLGSFFLEYADYYTRENNDEVMMLKLLFQSIRAIIKNTIDNRLVRVIFEIKAMCVNGEFPGIPTYREYNDATRFAISFIQNQPVEKLYTFKVTDEVLSELFLITDECRAKVIDRHFLSMDLLDESLLKI